MRPHGSIDQSLVTAIMAMDLKRNRLIDGRSRFAVFYFVSISIARRGNYVAENPSALPVRLNN